MLRIFSKHKTFTDSAKAIKVSAKRFSKYWIDIGLEKPNKTLAWKLIPDTPYNEIVIVSDLHFGNMCQQKTILNNFIKICKERSIDVLLCAGDLVDGTMTFPDHYKERFLHCADSYIEYCEENYPADFNTNGIIMGNHDKSLTLYENPNYDFCKEFCKVRKDVTYHIGNDNVTKPFTIPGNIKLTMYHGSNCTNSSLGQRREPKLQQKTAELLSSKNTSNIFIYGHCHKKCLTNFMDKYILGVGCFVADTPFQVNRGTFGDVCGLILKYNTENDKVVALEPEFFTAEQLGGLKIKDF